MSEAQTPDLDQFKSQLQGRPMILLAGEQAAPNLLPVRYLTPAHVIIVHTNMNRSVQSANNLALCLKKYYSVAAKLCSVDAYAPNKVFGVVQELLNSHPAAIVNITGGTKPMSIGALAAARVAEAPVVYVRSETGKTEVDLYQFDQQGVAGIAATHTITEIICIEEYLTLYLGDTFKITGSYGGKVTDPGWKFERAIHEALKDEVDDYKVGCEHDSKAMEIDAVVRCANQIAILEMKTGNAAGKADGIKQLAAAAEQKFLGTYVRRILVLDQSWVENERDNLRALAKAHGIILIELPSFAADRKLSEQDRTYLVEQVHKVLGKPVKPV